MPHPLLRWSRRALAACFLFAIFFWMGADSAAAHAIVVSTSLGEQTVKAETPTSVVLRFNVSVELPFTRLLLVNASGVKRPVGFAANSGRGEVIANLPPLPAGSYTLQYKVLASDGHVTEGIVPFRVSAP